MTIQSSYFSFRDLIRESSSMKMSLFSSCDFDSLESSFWRECIRNSYVQLCFFPAKETQGIHLGRSIQFPQWSLIILLRKYTFVYKKCCVSYLFYWNTLLAQLLLILYYFCTSCSQITKLYRFESMDTKLSIPFISGTR